jgi:hypothetical protein
MIYKLDFNKAGQLDGMQRTEYRVGNSFVHETQFWQNGKRLWSYLMVNTYLRMDFITFDPDQWGGLDEARIAADNWATGDLKEIVVTKIDDEMNGVPVVSIFGVSA